MPTPRPTRASSCSSASFAPPHHPRRLQGHGSCLAGLKPQAPRSAPGRGRDPLGTPQAGRCGVTGPTKAPKLSPTKGFLKPGLLLKNIPRRSSNLDEAAPAGAPRNKSLTGSPNGRAGATFIFHRRSLCSFVAMEGAGSFLPRRPLRPYCSHFPSAFCLVTTVSEPRLFTLSSNEPFHDLYNSTRTQSTRVPCNWDTL